MNTPVSETMTFNNQASLDGDGWAQLSPFGDFPGVALLRKPDGTVERSPAVQRLDRASADALIRRFRSPWTKLKRFLTGCPIFIGHPDTPGQSHAPDPLPKGMLTDLQIRDDGLYGLPVFTEETAELVAKRTFTALSVSWLTREIGHSNGSRIFTPFEIKSAGLTTRPNLPVRLLQNESTQHATQTSPSTCPIENTVAAQDQCDPSTPPKIALALNQAIVEGRVPFAERNQWVARLAADFANESCHLASRPPVLKTPGRSRTAGLGSRKAEFSLRRNERVALVHKQVRDLMHESGLDYAAAFERVQTQFPALFHAMQQPQTKNNPGGTR